MTSQAQNVRHKMAEFRAVFFATFTRPLLTSETERNCCEWIFLFLFFFFFFFESIAPVLCIRSRSPCPWSVFLSKRIVDITRAPFYRKHFQFDIHEGQTPNTRDTHSDGSVVLVDDLVHVEGPSAELCVLGGSLDGGQVCRPHVFGGIHPEPSHPEVDQVIVVANDHLPDVILALKKIINKQRELSSPTFHCCWTSEPGRLPACL